MVSARTRWAIVCLVLSGYATGGTRGQNSQFDVASVKPTNVAEQTYLVFYPGGRLSAKTLSLGSLIKAAWRLQSDQLDGPVRKWIRSEGFDVRTVQS
jgi:hypothetical protein